VVHRSDRRREEGAPHFDVDLRRREREGQREKYGLVRVF